MNVINRNKIVIKESDVSRYENQVQRNKNQSLDFVISHFYTPGTCECESETVKYKFLKLILERTSEDVNLSRSILFKFRQVFGLPDTLPTQEFEDTVILVSNEEETETDKNNVVSFSKKILMLSSEFFERMFNSSFTESHSDKVFVSLSSEAIIAFKNYIYTGVIENISIKAIQELYDFAYMAEMPELLELTENMVLDFFLKPENGCYINDQNLVFLKSHSEAFTERLFKSMQVESSTDYKFLRIKLSDYIKIFTNYHPMILEILAKNIISLEMDTKEFTPLTQIPKHFRRLINNVVGSDSFEASVQDLEKLIFCFPNIYDDCEDNFASQESVITSKHNPALEIDHNESSNYWHWIGMALKFFSDTNEDAKPYLVKAIELNDKLPYAYLLLSEIEEEVSEIGALYEKAVEADPKCSNALFKLGAHLIRQNVNDAEGEKVVNQGKKYLEKSIRLNRRNHKSYLTLAGMYKRNYEFKKAIEVLESGIEYATHIFSLKKELMETYLLTENYSGLISFFENHRDTANPLYAYALVMQGHLQKAEDVLNAPTGVGGTYPAILISLYLKQNRLEEAYKLIQEKHLYQQSTLLSLAIGDYYYSTSDLESALKNYVKAISEECSQALLVEIGYFELKEKIDALIPSPPQESSIDVNATIDELKKMKSDIPSEFYQFHGILRKVLTRLGANDEKIEDRSENPSLKNNKRKKPEETEEKEKVKESSGKSVVKRKKTENECNIEEKGKEKEL